MKRNFTDSKIILFGILKNVVTVAVFEELLNAISSGSIILVDKGEEFVHPYYLAYTENPLLVLETAPAFSVIATQVFAMVEWSKRAQKK